MTLERLTERLQEEKAKVGAVDGRRFNIRSKTKMTWEMRNIAKAIVTNQKKKDYGGNRSIFTKEELKEYKEIEEKFRKEQIRCRKMKEDATPACPPTSPSSTRSTSKPHCFKYAA